jgi:hypothetical protein
MAPGQPFAQSDVPETSKNQFTDHRNFNVTPVPCFFF